VGAGALLAASLLVTFAATSAGAAPSLRSGATTSEATAPEIPGVLLVGFTPGVGRGRQHRVVRANGARIQRRLLVKGVVLVRLPVGESVSAAEAWFRSHAAVRFAEPDYLAGVASAVVPNDPRFKNQWGLHNTGQTVKNVSGTPGADVNAEAAWGITTGSGSIKVGVIDTGIDFTHPDLDTQIDQADGANFVDPPKQPIDDQGHGTQVSGVIGAITNNSVGVAGVDWSAALVPVRVCFKKNSAPSCPVDELADGIAYAGQLGLKVANVSINLRRGSSTLKAAIDGAPNTLFVVTAGNQGSDLDSTPQYPCAYPDANLICVTATDQFDTLASFGNFGVNTVALAAPGVNIYTTNFLPASGASTYGYKSGTSYATAFVTGAAALLWSISPNSSVAAVKAALLGGVDVKPGLAGKVSTGGRLDILNSLQLIQANP
jgi:subtilisin family serine protease